MEFTNGDAVGNRLTLWDEALVRANRATGRVQMIQVVWVYEHPVNMDEVRRFWSPSSASWPIRSPTSC